MPAAPLASDADAPDPLRRDGPITVRKIPPDHADGYAPVARIGAGAMGEVHAARDSLLQRLVAIKQLHPRLAGHPALVERFYAEAQITAQLDHPAIVALHSLELAPGEPPRYAMRLVRGRTLRQVLEAARQARGAGRADPSLALPARLELFLHVCDAVAYAHSRGVIHRDLKPENVMVGPFREVQVMDWGVARVIGGPEPAEAPSPLAAAPPERTEHGLVVGTRRYMSPEQAAGRNDELDGRADQYALGVMLREIASLDSGSSVTWRAGADADPVPPDLAAIAARATAADRDRRYPSVDALAADVRRFLRDEEVEAHPDSRWRRVARWVGRNRQIALSIGLALALLVLLSAMAGLIGAYAVREHGQRAAAAREARLGAVTTAVTEQADRMDNRLLELQGLLTGLAFSAEQQLQRPASEERPLYFAEDYAAGQGPPDLAPSPVYEAPTSVAWPDIVAAPGVDRALAADRLQQLAALHPALLEVQLRSRSDDATALDDEARRRLIAHTGVPIVWAYVATEDGILVGAPGTGEYPDPYDPRTRPWYLVAKASRGPQWGAADADESGLGLLVTCSIGLRDAQDRFLGVAAIDLPFDYLIDELLDPPALEGRVEAFLVDAEGDTMVRSSQKARARDVTDYAPSRFAYVDALGDDARRTGYVELPTEEGTKLLVWRRLDAADWRYVVVGDASELLSFAPEEAP